MFCVCGHFVCILKTISDPVCIVESQLLKKFLLYVKTKDSDKIHVCAQLTIIIIIIIIKLLKSVHEI